MLRILRRNSKDTLGNAISTTAPAERATPDGTAESIPEEMNSERLSFFDLPAEIRNAIYEFVIADSKLSLPSSMLASAAKRMRMPLKRREKAQPMPINGLLLASKQCRREYLSMLFSCGSVAVEVKDFDFQGVMRVSSTLDEAEAQALLLNPNLTVQLVLQNCRPKDLNALRKWLQHRRDCTIRLPWKYEFATDRLLPPTVQGRIRLLRELAYYADTISMLAPDLDEVQRDELRLIVSALLNKVEWLEQDIGRPGERSANYSRNVRGLAGGGIL